MFAQVFADFDDRVREVDLYFQVLSALDNDEVAIIKGTGPQQVAEGAPPSDWGRMLKGAAYLVLYNLVEAFIRRGFQTVFDAIQNDGLCGVELTELLRAQWVMQKNKVVKAFDGSPKVYMGIANEIVNEIIGKQTAALVHNHLPISGNLDAAIIRQVCDLHGVGHQTPPAAKGGISLETVKIKRNALAHGNESFVQCGQFLTAATLVVEKNELVIYIRSILQNLEQFAIAKSYKI